MSCGELRPARFAPCRSCLTACCCDPASWTDSSLRSETRLLVRGGYAVGVSTGTRADIQEDAFAPGVLVELSSPDLQVYSATLTVQAKMTGFKCVMVVAVCVRCGGNAVVDRYLMYHWWLPSFFIGTFHLTMLYLCIFAVGALLLRLQATDTQMVRALAVCTALQLC